LDAEEAYVEGVWQEGAEALPERDRHFHQVGATFRGIRITDEQHDELCNSVIRGLKLDHTKDVLIDLCCGNGIVTSVLARHTSITIGVDFSTRLLDVAQQSYSAKNISYLCMNLRKPDASAFAEFPPVSKVCFHTAIQYFTISEVATLLMFLKPLSKGSQLKVFIGAIPDRSRKLVFYGASFRDRFRYLLRWLQRKGDIIGHWWTPADLKLLAERIGGKCECFQQEELQHTSHYRFDAIITLP